jgi:hypothetical protein
MRWGRGMSEGVGVVRAGLDQVRSFTNGWYQVVGRQNGSGDAPALSSTIATLCLALVTAT